MAIIDKLAFLVCHQARLECLLCPALAAVVLIALLYLVNGRFEELLQLCAFFFDRTAHKQAEPTGCWGFFLFVFESVAIVQEQLRFLRVFFLLQISAVDVALIHALVAVFFAAVNERAVLMRLCLEA